MLNNYSKKPTGGAGHVDDTFNKKKAADEAKRIREERIAIQNQQEKNKLQLQISNLERELSRLEQEVRLAESKLGETKRKEADAKRALFLTESDIKKQEGGASYLNASVSAHDNKESSANADLEKAKADQVLASKDKLLARDKYMRLEVSLADLQRQIAKLEAELIQLKGEAENTKQQLDKQNEAVKALERIEGQMNQKVQSLEVATKQVSSVKTKIIKEAQTGARGIKEEKQQLVFKKRLVEQIETEGIIFTQKLDKLKKDLEDKKRTIDNLKRQRDAIR